MQKNKFKKFFFIICFFNIFFTVQAYANNPVPLPIDKAFVLTVKENTSQSVLLHFDIAPGYHLYRSRFQFVLEKPGQLGKVILPPGKAQYDDILGHYFVYEHQLDLRVPIINSAKNNTLNVSYQGCSSANFCYPPVTQKVALGKRVSLQSQILNLLKHGNYFWICVAFLGMGILLTFTPCVLPMIPILSGIILGQNKKSLNTRKAFLLSLSYVLGMSLMYAIAGLLVALAGSHLTEAFQTPWVIIVFSIIFILLALSLFDFYALCLPHFLQQPIIYLSNRQKSGSYIGAFLMGALSVLIVSPCVTAPLVGILTFIAESGSIFLGSIALFSLGLGMGIPLLIIGTTEGKFLPKAGAWMKWVKIGFGILLLGVAILLLERVLPINNPPISQQFTLKSVQKIIKTNHKPVMLDFYANWCVACHEMDKNVFSQPAVQKQLNNFLVIRIDVTDNTSEDQRIERYFHVIAPPTLLFFNSQGQEIKEARIVGYVDAKTFLSIIANFNEGK